MGNNEKKTNFAVAPGQQAGVSKVAQIVGGLALSGAAVYGVLAYAEHQRDQELFDQLKVSAAKMSADSQSIEGIRAYFDKEAARLEQYHQKNQTLLDQDKDLALWLSAIPGAPTMEELRQEEAQRYASSKARLASEREAADKVWMALSSPEDFEKLKEGLTRQNLETYALVKSCAARKAGEGVYCGEMAAVGARVSVMLRQAQQMRQQSEEEGRSMLAQGWSGWEEAEKSLLALALADIGSEEAKAKASFESGELEKEDWEAMQSGFAAAKTAAAEQIQSDRANLESQAHSGGLGGFQWLLLGYMMRSAPSMGLGPGMNSLAARPAAPYMAGGSAHRPLPMPAAAREEREQNGGGGAGGYRGGFAGSAAGHTTALAPKVAAMPKTAPVATVNPYSAMASNSRLGSRVNASFDAAAGRVSTSAASSASKGLAGKAASYSASRAAARSAARATAARAAAARSSGSYGRGGYGGGG